MKTETNNITVASEGKPFMITNDTSEQSRAHQQAVATPMRKKFGSPLPNQHPFSHCKLTANFRRLIAKLVQGVCKVSANLRKPSQAFASLRKPQNP